VSFDGFNLNTSYPKEHAMKRALLILSLLLAGTASAQVNNWNNSPNNWNAANGVYNNQGNRMGYLPSQKQ
jgi:hypothetical protein